MKEKTFQLRTEDRALLDILRAEPSKDLPSFPEHAWEGVTDRAFRLGIAPFLYKHLMSAEFTPPGDTTDRLRHAFLSNSARNTIIFGKLRPILEAFAEEQIPLIVLKGAALAEPFYGDHGSRPMGDVDLLVDRKDLHRGKALLEREGLKQIRRIPPEQEIEVWHHLSPFTDGREQSSLVIELHWRLLRPGFPCRETVGLWGGTIREKVAGVEVPTLGSEDLVLYTCLHTLEHGWTGGLKQLLDLATILDRQREHTDWELLSTISESVGASGAVAMGLQLLRDLLDAPLPDGASAFLERNRPDPAITDLALHQIFDSFEADHPVSANLTRLRHADGLAAKSGVVLRRLFPPRRELAARYGMSLESPFFPLLYLVHPFTMIRIHGHAELDLLLEKKGAVAADEENVRRDELVRNLVKGRPAPPP